MIHATVKPFCYDREADMTHALFAGIPSTETPLYSVRGRAGVFINMVFIFQGV